MPSYPDLIFGVLLPGLLAGVILIAGWPPWRHVRIDSSRGLTSVPLAMLIALLACFVYAAGWWKLGPADLWQRIGSLQLWQRLVVLAITATALAVASVIGRRSRWSSYLIGLALAAVTVLVMRPPNAAEHPLLSRWTLGGMVLALHWCLTPLARRRPGALLPLAGVICFAGASIVLIHTRNAKLGLMSASLSAACGWAVLVSCMTHQLSMARGGVAFFATMLPALLVVGAWYDYGAVPTGCFVAVALAPLLLWAGELGLRRRRTWQATFVATAIVTVIVGAAVALMVLKDVD